VLLSFLFALSKAASGCYNLPDTHCYNSKSWVIKKRKKIKYWQKKRGKR
jgi:hypothetical protein